MGITDKERGEIFAIKGKLGLNNDQTKAIMNTWKETEGGSTEMKYQIISLLFPLAMVLMIGYGWWKEIESLRNVAGWMSIGYGIIFTGIWGMGILILWKGGLDKKILGRSFIRSITPTSKKEAIFRYMIKTLWLIGLILLSNWAVAAIIVFIGGVVRHRYTAYVEKKIESYLEQFEKEDR